MAMNPRLLRPTASGFDPDAAAYIRAVEIADAQSLEAGVKRAIDNFVRGCKADGIWSAIKASCILMGARTLSGALTPLKPLGSELWSVITPSVTEFGGSSGSWTSGTRTMTNTGTGSNASYPRFLFSLPLVSVGKRYDVSGRLTGDTDAVVQIRLAITGAASGVSYNSTTGVFSSTAVTAGAASIEFSLNATLGTKSVSIAELSIKETTAPTNVNFVSGDYNRKTGLVGNGSNKYLNSNRNANADPQDNFHMAVAVSASGISSISMGAGAGNAGSTQFTLSDIRCRNLNAVTRSVTSTDAGLRGMSRTATAGDEFVSRWLGSNQTHNIASQAPFNGDIFVYARNSSGPGLYSDMRCYWYSIGESLDLALLDTRVAALYSSIGAAIPS